MLNKFLLIIIFKIIFCYIVLPIDTLPKENYRIQSGLNYHEEIINNEYKQIFFTELEMGTPIQKVPLLIKTESSYYIITSINSIQNSTSYKYRDIFNFSESFLEKNKYDFYNETKSSSYILNNCDYPKVYEAEEYCNSNETFLFYNNINLQNKSKNEKIYFELMRNVEDNITGEIGLNLYDRNKWSFNSFINILKTRKIIENYNWFIDFDTPSSKKGKIIVGALPHEVYPDNYMLDDLNYEKAIAQSFLLYWRMKFNKIYVKNNNKENIYFNETIIEFKLDSNVIIGTYEYENYILNIFDKFLKEKKCFNDTINDYKIYNNKLTFYYCKNEKNIKNELFKLLPNIYFYSNEFNYTFQLNNDELWEINNDYIYYKVLFGSLNNKYWYLGKPMSLKYKFIFNPETKQIGFYNKYYTNKEKNSSKNNNTSLIIKISVIIVLICFFIFLGIRLGKMIYGMKRKKRANELVDDFDYLYDDNKAKKDNNEDLAMDK